jgi:uncharacterized protein with HEPN domain
MQPERLYLADIVSAADAVARFLAGVEREAFTADDLLRSAVLHKLTVIGEAAARLPTDLRARRSEVPWASIIAFRNIAVHAYLSVDWSIMWDAATRDTPLLRQQVARILADLPGDS